MDNGAKGVKEPWEEKDEHGSVVMATVQTVSYNHNRKTTLTHLLIYLCVCVCVCVCVCLLYLDLLVMIFLHSMETLPTHS